jgi:hypothetical protein
MRSVQNLFALKLPEPYREDIGPTECQEQQARWVRPVFRGCGSAVIADGDLGGHATLNWCRIGETEMFACPMYVLKVEILVLFIVSVGRNALYMPGWPSNEHAASWKSFRQCGDVFQ